MAEIDTKWGLNLDKIAYGTGGALALLIFCVPLLAPAPDETGLLSAIDGFQKVVSDVRRSLSERRDEGPPLAATLAKQWDAGSPCPVNPKWVTERAPVLLRKIPAAVTADPIHEKGEISEISLQRDAKRKRPYLVVKGRPGEGRYVIVRSMSLLKKAGEGEFREVKDFAANGEFEFQDYDVVPGVAYTYKLTTTAERDPAAPQDLVKPLAAGEETKESDPLGPTPPVPFDYNLTVVNVDKPAAPGETPRFFGRFSYWDYEKNQIVQVNRGSLQSFVEKQRVGENLGGNGRYEFLIVDDLAQVVTVKDHLRAGTESTEKFKKDPRAARPVDVWARPVRPGGEEPEAKEGGEEKAPVAKETPPAKTPSTKTPPSKTAPGTTKTAPGTSKTTPQKKTTTQKKFR
ncbi:MAG: hypothetical protein ACUVYA_05270 [Planctomycetota bacterium]